MYVSIWRFRIGSANRTRFEEAYGPDGDWARLFRRQPGFVGTELLREEEADADGTAAYLTIDRWRARSDWLDFQDAFGDDYRALDRACEELTAAEERIGGFTATD